MIYHYLSWSIMCFEYLFSLLSIVYRVHDARFQKLIGNRKERLYNLRGLNVVAIGVDLLSFCWSPYSSNFYFWNSCISHVSVSQLRYLISKGTFKKLAEIFFIAMVAN